eukprot:scaffold4802_cov112-Isochrysis_galbana.AAC.5
MGKGSESSRVFRHGVSRRVAASELASHAPLACDVLAGGRPCSEGNEGNKRCTYDKARDAAQRRKLTRAIHTRTRTHRGSHGGREEEGERRDRPT